MLNLILYKNTQEVYSFNFINNNKKNLYLEKYIVTPGPKIADVVRGKISEISDTTEVIDVITMAKFIKNELVRIGGGELLEKFKRKEDLLLIYGRAWKRLWANCSFENFLHAYKLFTDLRSLTLNQELIGEFCQELEENLKNQILSFWELSKNLDILDEHSAYGLIAEKSVSTDQLKQKRLYIFSEFSYLSAVQVDLLKRLAEGNDVFVLFPEDAYLRACGLDWIYWLDNNRENKKDNDNDNDKNNDKDIDIKARPYFFTKNNLKNILTKAITEVETEIEIFLSTLNNNFFYTQEIPFSNLFFKYPVEIFEEYLDTQFENIIESFPHTIHAEAFKVHLQDTIKKLTNQKDLKKDLNNFKLLKATLLIYHSLLKWMDLSQDHRPIDHFDFKLFKEVSRLRLPRLYNIPILNNNFGKIEDFNTLLSFNPNKTTVLIISSDYQLDFISNNYPEKMLSKLLSIGPIPRKELGILILSSKIKEMLRYKNVILLIEEGLIEESYLWHKVFENTKIKEINMGENMTEKQRTTIFEGTITPINEIINDKIILSRNNTISATRLQNYLDCPRKYYLNHLEKIAPQFIITSDFTVQDRGSIAHSILESYFTQTTSYNKNLHLTVVKETIAKHIEKNKMQIETFDYEMMFAEMRRSTFNTINYINEVILKNIINPKLYFEYKLKKRVLMGFKIKGSVDLLIECNNNFYIYDFKRSSSSIAKDKEIVNYKKIQLWFYIRHLGLNPKNISGLGYINLKSPKKSLLYRRDNKKNESFFINFDERLQKYKEVEKNSLTILKNDNTYKVCPRDPKVCDYCFIKSICPKE
ncbi:MAG: PD-(D/E)XK nuclease family protein [Oligoflexia bacterium]|nr:PD-(D/E)XK nuclease family protein [Oligoflexia bacterium]